MADTARNSGSSTARDRERFGLAIERALEGNVGAIAPELERVSTPAAIAGYRDGLVLLLEALEAELLRRLEELSELARGGK